MHEYFSILCPQFLCRCSPAFPAVPRPAPRPHTPKRASGSAPASVFSAAATGGRCCSAAGRLGAACTKPGAGTGRAFLCPFRPGVDQGKDQFATVRKRFTIEKALTRPIPTVCAPAWGVVCIPGPARPTRSAQPHTSARVPFYAVSPHLVASPCRFPCHTWFLYLTFCFGDFAVLRRMEFCQNGPACCWQDAARSLFHFNSKKMRLACKMEHTVKVHTLGYSCFIAEVGCVPRAIPYFLLFFQLIGSVLQMDPWASAFSVLVHRGRALRVFRRFCSHGRRGAFSRPEWFCS